MAKRIKKEAPAVLSAKSSKVKKEKKAPTKKAAAATKSTPAKSVKKPAAKKKEKNEAAELASLVIKGIKEKKGKNITCLNLTEIQSRVCDYFIICEGDSTTHVGAIADSVEDEVRKAINEKPYHTEGYENSEWILIDYVTVVVHVFQKEIRNFYKLEALWADAKAEEES